MTKKIERERTLRRRAERQAAKMQQHQDTAWSPRFQGSTVRAGFTTGRKLFWNQIRHPFRSFRLFFWLAGIYGAMGILMTQVVMALISGSADMSDPAVAAEFQPYTYALWMLFSTLLGPAALLSFLASHEYVIANERPPITLSREPLIHPAALSRWAMLGLVAIGFLSIMIAVERTVSEAYLVPYLFTASVLWWVWRQFMWVATAHAWRENKTAWQSLRHAFVTFPRWWKVSLGATLALVMWAMIGLIAVILFLLAVTWWQSVETFTPGHWLVCAAILLPSLMVAYSWWCGWRGSIARVLQDASLVVPTPKVVSPANPVSTQNQAEIKV